MYHFDSGLPYAVCFDAPHVHAEVCFRATNSPDSSDQYNLNSESDFSEYCGLNSGSDLVTLLWHRLPQTQDTRSVHH